MNKITLLSTLCLAAACGNVAPSATGTTSALSASDAVRAYGIDGYVVTGDEIQMLDRVGVEVGHAWVSAPSINERLVRISLADGGGDDVEISRQTQGAFEISLVNSTLSSALLADPALSPLMSRFDVQVSLHAATVSADLQTDALATCLAANTGAGCYNASSHPCYTSADYNTWQRDSEQLCNDESLCQSWCGSVYQFGWDQYGPDGPSTYCTCGYRTTAKTWPASCPKVSCGVTGQRDQVDRTRTCTEPGDASTCVNQSPYVGCANW